VSISFFGEHKLKHCIFEGEQGDSEHSCAREEEEEEVGEGGIFGRKRMGTDHTDHMHRPHA